MNPFVLDIRTLSFTTTSIALLFALGFFSFGLLQKRFKGFHILAAASASHSLGLFLLGFRDALPDLLTIVAALAILSFLSAREFYRHLPKFAQSPKMMTATIFIRLYRK